MGWSPIRNIVGAVKDVGSAIDDAVISKVVDPVVTMGEQFEDLTREGIEGIDEAIQNPYVRMVVGAVIPGSKPWIDAYAKLDSGEELGTADYVSLGLSGAEDFANAEIPEEVKIGLKVGTRINAGEDPVDILVDEYGDNYIADLELDVKLDTNGVETAVELDAEGDTGYFGPHLLSVGAPGDRGGQGKGKDCSAYHHRQIF